MRFCAYTFSENCETPSPLPPLSLSLSLSGIHFFFLLSSFSSLSLGSTFSLPDTCDSPADAHKSRTPDRGPEILHARAHGRYWIACAGFLWEFGTMCRLRDGDVKRLRYIPIGVSSIGNDNVRAATHSRNTPGERARMRNDDAVTPWGP